MRLFSTVKVPKPKRSNFNLSHTNLLTTEFGRLTPFLLLECLPGDSFRISNNMFTRLAPMVSPILSNIDIKVEYFFVPNRLLWSEWETFITGGPDGDQVPVLPALTGGLVSRCADYKLETVNTPKKVLGLKTLMNYLGYPFSQDSPSNHENKWSSDTPTGVTNILPLLAYNKIVNDYYIDQNLELVDNKPRRLDFWDTDPDTGYPKSVFYSDTFQLYYRNYRKDYFTSALPWTQRGPNVVLPFDGGERVAVKVDTLSAHHKPSLIYGINERPTEGSNLQVGSADAISPNALVQNDNGNKRYVGIYNPDQYVDISGTAPTINELRRSFSVQRWLEASARGGSRLIEQILVHFGVKSSDSRLQRSEYLSGSSTPVLISQVLQNSASQESSALGSMAGHGVSAVNQKSFRYYCQEHGYIIGLLSVVPQTYYYQGLHRTFSRQDKFDFAWPEFGHLGEQPIYNSEIYLTDDVADWHTVFGYTPRYSEYKFMNNTIKGDFQFSLDQFTTARMFGNLPQLNASFNHIEPSDINHIFASTDGSFDHFWIAVFNNVKVKRCLPYYGTPSSI